jgi:hypothetical protein
LPPSDQPLLVPAGFFVARTPLLASTAYQGQPPEIALEDAVVREAIGLASPSLLQEFSKPGRDLGKARLALQRYLMRMRSRPTPFSLMAGYTHGLVGGSVSEIHLAEIDNSRRIIRIDVDCVASIVHAQVMNPEVRARTRWRTRRDLMVLEDVVRVTVRDIGDRHEVSCVDIVRSEALDRALRVGEEFAAPITAFVECLRPFAPDVETAQNYVEALIERGLLVPDDLVLHSWRSR